MLTIFLANLAMEATAGMNIFQEVDGIKGKLYIWFDTYCIQ